MTAQAKILPFRGRETKAQGPYAAPLRVLPFGSVLNCRCKDCGLERQESVSRLITEGRLGNASAMTLEHVLNCQRMACGGDMDIAVVLGD